MSPLVRFARKFKTYLDSIIASARNRLSTSALEGMNNKIKVIKRMAYGYRDTAYFWFFVDERGAKRKAALDKGGVTESPAAVLPL